MRLFDSWPQMSILTQMSTISLAGTDAVPCISAGCELELAESDGAPDFDGMPDFSMDLNLEQLPVYL